MKRCSALAQIGMPLAESSRLLSCADIVIRLAKSGTTIGLFAHINIKSAVILKARMTADFMLSHALFITSRSVESVTPSALFLQLVSAF